MPPPHLTLPLTLPHLQQLTHFHCPRQYESSPRPVIENITFTIPGCSSVGVVGRTGAGKSTISLALLRMIEACNGKLSIDGVDLSTLSLETLRSRVAVVPQDPILFSGTVRLVGLLDPSTPPPSHHSSDVTHQASPNPTKSHQIPPSPTKTHQNPPKPTNPRRAPHLYDPPSYAGSISTRSTTTKIMRSLRCWAACS